jgi:hypothetical protein
MDLAQWKKSGEPTGFFDDKESGRQIERKSPPRNEAHRINTQGTANESTLAVSLHKTGSQGRQKGSVFNQRRMAKTHDSKSIF